MDWANVTGRELWDALREVELKAPRAAWEFLSSFTIPKNQTKWTSRLKCNGAREGGRWGGRRAAGAVLARPRVCVRGADARSRSRRARLARSLACVVMRRLQLPLGDARPAARSQAAGRTSTLAAPPARHAPRHPAPRPAARHPRPPAAYYYISNYLLLLAVAQLLLLIRHPVALGGSAAALLALLSVNDPFASGIK